MISTCRYTNVMTGESEIFVMWKQFIETITADWMVDNVLNSGHTDWEEEESLHTHIESGLFNIIWGDKWYSFRIPQHLQITNCHPDHNTLNTVNDRKLLKCLPIDVMKDFVGVIEL